MKRGLIVLLGLLMLLSLQVAQAKEWQVQVDPSGAANCTISYNNAVNRLNVNADKTLNRGAGSCLPLNPNRFWLKMQSTPDCLSTSYNISCNQEFTASLFYYDNGVYNFPFDPISASANDVIELAIPSETPAPPATNISECEQNGYSCSGSCSNGEMDYFCFSGVCCAPPEPIQCITEDDCAKPECYGQSVVDLQGNPVVCEAQQPLPSLDTCQNLSGISCSSEETCEGGSFAASSDSERCCIGGICAPQSLTCEGQGGILCATAAECAGTLAASSDAGNEFCCQGQCQKTPSSSRSMLIPMIIFILIAVLIVSFVLYRKGVFKFKKKVQEQPFSFPPSVKPLYPSDANFPSQ